MTALAQFPGCERSYLPRTSSATQARQSPQIVEEEEARYGEEFVMRAQLAQGAFRVLVTEAYTRRYAVTGERTLPVLQAAHIKPFAKSGPHRVDNGLLLRSGLHTLFDRGYVTVTPEHRVEVSRRIREEFENGRDCLLSPITSESQAVL
jgi:putative restriction endonuclease